MPGPPIAEFEEGQTIEGFYAVREAELRTTAQGKSFIRLLLGDASGAITGNMWDASPEIYQSLDEGGVAKVRAHVETYRGNLQMKITALRPARESEVDPADFVATTTADIEELKRELLALIDGVEDADYNALLHAFFDEAEMLAAFARAPAARENHHAYIGGLLEHTVSIAKLADTFCAARATLLDRNLLLTGTLLHDIGKVRELSVNAAIEYTDEGNLIGHLSIGALMTAERARTIAGFPEEKLWLVQHLILSHHGRREYGSPVLPATPEALALHHLDNLDAKTVAARRIIDANADSNSHWTERSWMFETRLFKGAGS